MTPHRAAGPGPRTVAPHRRSGALAGLFLAVLVAVLVAACGSSSVTPSGPAATGGLLGPGVDPSGGAGSASPAGGTGSTVPDPSQPRWPGTTVLAVIALGASDGEIQKAGADLQSAADAEDLRAMWGAADGLAKMIDGLIPNLDRLDVYEGTRPIAALYRKAFPEISAAAKHIRDSITSGDAPGIAAGYQELAAAIQDYAPIRLQIGDLVEQAILQQRLLTE
jgi:hypothetical protein